MNYLNLSNYERMSSHESWSRFNWGVDDPSATVYHLKTDEFEIFVCDNCPGYGETDAHNVICEVNDEFGGLLAQSFEQNEADAIRAAFVAIAAPVPMRKEACTEDAVNVIAYTVYQSIIEKCAMCEMNVEQVAKLQETARKHVERNIRFASFDWDEF
jgi:hypothetical protein